MAAEDVKKLLEGCKVECLSRSPQYGHYSYRYKVSPIPAEIPDSKSFAEFVDGGPLPFGGRGFSRFINEAENYVEFTGIVHTD